MLKKLLPLFLIPLTFSLTFASEKPVRGEAQAIALSRYVFRGVPQSDQPIYNAKATINYKGLFGTLDSYSHLHTQFLQELDMYTGYKFTKDTFWAKIQHIKYSIVDGPDTHEIGLGIGLDGRFRPSINFYRDLDAGLGNFLELSFDYTVAKGEQASVDFNTKLSAVFDHEVFGRNTEGDLFNDAYHAEFTAVLKAYLDNNFSLYHMIGYSLPFSGASEAAIKSVGKEPEDGAERAFGALGVSLEF